MQESIEEAARRCIARAESIENFYVRTKDTGGRERLSERSWRVEKAPVGKSFVEHMTIRLKFDLNKVNIEVDPEDDYFLIVTER